MFPLPNATTANMTLADVITRLSGHPMVDGLITIGTTNLDEIAPHSDYDLVVVLNDMPVPLHVGITFIDHRLTDVLFARTTHIDQILSATVALESDAWEGRVARWLLNGIIAFDRHGRLHQAQHKAQHGNWIRPLEEIDAYGAWIGVNYNLLHTRRMFDADDPVYRQAAELRIALYGITSVVFSYFQIRKLLWEGDKAAIRYLMANDPSYFALLQQCMREPNPRQKFALYEQIAAATLAPIGELWQGEPTILWSDIQPATWETLSEGLAFWEHLVAVHP